MLQKLLSFFARWHQPPAAEGRRLRAEEVWFQHRSVAVRTHHDHYRAPGRWFDDKTAWGRCSVIGTRHGLYAYAWRRRIVGFHFDDATARGIRCTLAADGALLIRTDAGRPAPEASGTSATLLSFPEAALVVARLATALDAAGPQLHPGASSPAD